MYSNILVFLCVNLKVVIVWTTFIFLMRPIQNQMYKITPAVYIYFAHNINDYVYL